MALFETVVPRLETGAKWITVQFQGLGRYGGAEAKAASAENPKLLPVVAAPFKYHPSHPLLPIPWKVVASSGGQKLASSSDQ